MIRAFDERVVSTPDHFTEYVSEETFFRMNSHCHSFSKWTHTAMVMEAFTGTVLYSTCLVASEQVTPNFCLFGNIKKYFLEFNVTLRGTK